MVGKIIKQASAAFQRGEMAAAAGLLSDHVVRKAKTRQVADEIRIIRALALLGAGNPREAVASIAQIDPERLGEPPFCRVAAAAYLGLGDLSRAGTLLAALVQAGQQDAIPAYRACLVREGLAALAGGDPRAALATLQKACVVEIQHGETRYAGWIGLMVAALEADKPGDVLEVFARCQEWSGDKLANFVAARAAIAVLDVPAAERHLRASGRSAGVDALWWDLCRRLFSARRFKEVVALFGSDAEQATLDQRGVARVILAIYARAAIGQAKQGKEEIDALARRFPHDELILYHAGLYSFLCGYPQASDEYLRRLTGERGASLLLLWAIAFLEQHYEMLHRELNLDTINAWPEGPERELLRLLAAASCAAMGDIRKCADHLKEADEARTPEKMRTSQRHLRGYVSLLCGEYRTARELLERTPLARLAHLESARENADQGNWKEALSDLDSLEPQGWLAKHIIETLGRVRLLQAEAALRGGSCEEAARVMSLIRKETPAIADEAGSLEDHIYVSASLAGIDAGDPGQTAERLWWLSDKQSPGVSAREKAARRRDLAFLAAGMWFRAIAKAPGMATEGLKRAVDALEASLREDGEFGPSAAVLGVVLYYSGQKKRALKLLDVGARQGISSPAFKTVLAAEYASAGRLLEAKRMFFDIIVAFGEQPVVQRNLASLIALEDTPLLSPAKDSQLQAPRGEFPDKNKGTGGIDLFAGTEPRRRMHILLHHLESLTAKAPMALQAEWRSVVKQMKRSAIAGDEAGIIEAEKKSLALLALEQGR